jgi:hypothetical protein
MKQNLASTYFCRREDTRNMVTENAEICFLPPGHTDRQEKCSVLAEVAARIAEGMQD